MAIILTTPNGVEALDTGDVEFSNDLHIFKLQIRSSDDLGNALADDAIPVINEITIQTIIEKIFQKAYIDNIPISRIDKESIIIDKINSTDGNSDLEIFFNNKENTQAYVVGTTEKRNSTIQFFIDLQKLTDNYFLIAFDDNSFENNVGFGIEKDGLFPLCTMIDYVTTPMKQFFSYDEYMERNPIIDEKIQKTFELILENRPNNEEPVDLTGVFKHPDFKDVVAEYIKEIDEYITKQENA